MRRRRGGAGGRKEEERRDVHGLRSCLDIGGVSAKSVKPSTKTEKICHLISCGINKPHLDADTFPKSCTGGVRPLPQCRHCRATCRQKGHPKINFRSLSQRLRCGRVTAVSRATNKRTTTKKNGRRNGRTDVFDRVSKNKFNPPQHPESPTADHGKTHGLHARERSSGFPRAKHENTRTREHGARAHERARGQHKGRRTRMHPVTQESRKPQKRTKERTWGPSASRRSARPPPSCRARAARWGCRPRRRRAPHSCPSSQSLPC